MTIREYLQINDGWFSEIIEHLQYRYFLDGYTWKIEPIEKRTVQRISFDMFVTEIFALKIPGFLSASDNSPFLQSCQYGRRLYFSQLSQGGKITYVRL